MTMRPRGTRARRLTVACAALAAVGLLGACGSKAAPGGGTPTTAPVTTPPAATPTATPTGRGTPSTSTAGFDAAQGQWKLGADAISADQGNFWLKAAGDLKQGETSDSGDTSGYAQAESQLKELTSLPDAQQTPAQNATYHADIDALNTFFMTPGLYS